MTARDAQTWGASASLRAAEAAVRVRRAGEFAVCDECGPLHGWHGLACAETGCDCLTSWTDEGISA